MSTRLVKRIALAVFLLMFVGVFLYAFRTKPIPVDIATITAGPMLVTVDEEGKTRIKEIYKVSAPIAGKLSRIGLDPGDRVVAGDTIVAVLRPLDPSILDRRTRSELDAAVQAAKAAVVLADAEIRRTRVELGFAEAELERAKKLSRSQTISPRALEKAALDAESLRAALARAEAQRELRVKELDSARARLIGPETRQDNPTKEESCCVNILAPASGAVLRVMDKSEQVVAAGTPLLEIGDSRELEIIVDLISNAATRIAIGADATVDGWGGKPLQARVRRIEPIGFTKISALGIEEQRVRTVLDLAGPPEVHARLGHEYAVFVKITAWRGEDVVRVPIGALFRHEGRWSVFKLVDGNASRIAVDIDHRNAEFAQVRSGLAAGDKVILHPNDRVADKVRVEPRVE